MKMENEKSVNKNNKWYIAGTLLIAIGMEVARIVEYNAIYGTKCLEMNPDMPVSRTPMGMINGLILAVLLGKAIARFREKEKSEHFSLWCKYAWYVSLGFLAYHLIIWLIKIIY